MFGRHYLASRPWLSTVQQSGAGFAFTSGGDVTVASNCFAVLAAELLGDWPLEGQVFAEAGTHIAAAQCEDGLWHDPELVPETLEGRHGLDYMQVLTSYFAVHALDALGRRPVYPLRFLNRFMDARESVDWLLGWDLSQFWYASNEIMWLLSFLEYESGQGNCQADIVIEALLGKLDEMQDPQTGYWGTDRGANLFNGMAGAFHIYYFYFSRGRRINHVARIIDNTLSLQHEDGLFNRGGGGGACHDLDAIDILVKFSMLTDYRAADVSAALRRAYHALWKAQNADGGFCELVWRPYKSWKRRIGELFGLDKLLHRPIQQQPGRFRYGGWSKMQCRKNESNAWAMWFRPLAFALISVRYPGRYLGNGDWTFRRLPGLGWCDSSKVSACPFSM